MTLLPSAAERLLQSLGVESPSEIDLPAIAWHLGVVDIRERPLDGCEARIVGTRGKAIISVKRGVRRTRQRFSICHELGHWYHHRGQLLLCKASDMHQHDTSQRDTSKAKEAVANRFGSDLLLPPYLVRPMVDMAKPIELKLVKQVADEFSASLTATARKLVALSEMPSLIVRHGLDGTKWHWPGNGIARDWFPKPELDDGSPAFRMLYSGMADQAVPRRVKASFWFDRWDAERFDVLEQSFRPRDGEVLTILTLNDHRMAGENRCSGWR